MSPPQSSVVRRFSDSPTGPPTLMVVVAVVGLLWANLDWASYHQIVDAHLTIGVGAVKVNESVHGWINEGLMTLFFFAVGLEIKREMAVGELRDVRRAALPALAAVGGMVVPAGLYLLVNGVSDSGSASGWAIPVATDIAFTLGVLSLLGPRVSVHLRLFVLTLAIVDDVGGIIIIAVGFSEGVNLTALLGAIAALVAMHLMGRSGIRSTWPYIPIGVATWYLTFKAGIEPTIAGVAIGLLTPARPVRGRPVLEDLEHVLRVVTATVVLPLFAFANMGIPISRTVLEASATNPVAIGIFLGLVVGKPVGVLVATKLTLRLGIGVLHPTVAPRLLAPTAMMTGIGFTVALFIADLSFAGADRLDEAKLAILAASVVAAGVGYVSFIWIHGRSDEVLTAPTS